MTVQKYVKYATGRAATQEEISNTLKCYFILNEIGNQIRYLRKKAASNEEDRQNNQKDLFWTMNLISNSHQNNLAKAGLFSKCIEEGIQSTREFILKTTGQEPSQEEIAESLKCTFILSEIKNQINWQRKNPEKAAGSDPVT